MFPKAHATAYVSAAWRIAWYKINRAIEYYATFFYVKCFAFDLEVMEAGYDAIKEKMAKENLEINNLWVCKKSGSHGKEIDIKSITATNEDIDEDGFFYGKHVVFTGKLERMTRKEAMQLVVNVGGILDKSVTKTTNYLILGDNDYNAILKGEKSSKHKKAEKLKLDGQDIDILDELTFYDILEV